MLPGLPERNPGLELANAFSVTDQEFYRMKIGKVDVIALTDGTISVDFLALLTNTKPGEVETLG